MKIASIAGICALTAGAVFTNSHAVRIDESSLRARLEIIAHDSMQGRATGSKQLARVTNYVVAELRRIGVRAGGDSGGFTQSVPIAKWVIDGDHASAAHNRQRLYYGVDFFPMVGAFGLNTARRAHVTERDRVEIGRLGSPSTVRPESAAGRVALFTAPSRANGQRDYQLWNVRAQLEAYKSAAAILIYDLDLAPRAFRELLTQPQLALKTDNASEALPPIVLVAYTWGEWILAGSTQFSRDEAIPGMVGGTWEMSFDSRDVGLDAPARNVVAIIEGTDPKLKSEFVVLSAHMDHLGVASPDDRTGADSIYNGADDSGTGTVALLAIAEALKASPPKRSVLLLWTTGEEQGFLGSEYFVNHPTVPRDSIVANISLDMLGRGGANDVPGGGPMYLELHGAQRSAALAARITTVNARSSSPFAFAGLTDAPDSLRCDGDDWHFARWGIPSVRISTGQSPDFHRVGDDVSRIDFAKFAKATEFAVQISMDVANVPDPPRKSAADQRRACVH